MDAFTTSARQACLFEVARAAVSARGLDDAGSAPAALALRDRPASGAASVPSPSRKSAPEPARGSAPVAAAAAAPAPSAAPARAPAPAPAPAPPSSLVPAATAAVADARPAPIRPESLHPTLWLGHQLARHAESGVATGFAALDAQLPGGGWPRRALTELLLPRPGVGEVRLVAPSLVGVQRAGRLVMLFDPPVHLSAAALAQLGVEVEDLLVVSTRARVIPGTDSLWALEQALRSGHVGAVLAWLPPRLRAERLRRLQLAAQAHDGPAFVLCETSAAQRPTAAPLRLALRPGGADRLAVRVLKRRGPPLESPLQIDLPPVLSEVARQRARCLAADAHAAGDAAAPAGAAPLGGQRLAAATFIDLAP